MEPMTYMNHPVLKIPNNSTVKSIDTLKLYQIKYIQDYWQYYFKQDP